MTSEELDRLAESLEAEAEELWERMEKTNRKPVIQPPDVISVAARTVGKMEGWAKAIRWHATHDGGD